MTDAAVEFVVGTPGPPLRALVDAYRGYRIEGRPGIHRGLPSRHLTFIVSLGDPVDITSMPGRVDGPGRFQAFVGGLHSEPASIRHDGFEYGIGLDLTPHGARSLLGVPAAALTDGVVHLEDVFGPSATSLVDRLHAAPDWSTRRALLDEFLVARLDAASGPKAEMAWAWRRLTASAGRIRVSALAAELGYSRRHFGEQFRREFGLAPKAAARVLRFERSRELLTAPDRPTLAGVAASSGYADQAHLTREWRSIAGCTPTTWLREELPFVQDGATVAASR